MAYFRSCATLMLAFVAGSASAAFVQYNTTISPQAGPFASNFTTQKFDTNLGTLTGVLLTLSSNISAQIDVWNTLPTAAAFSNAFATFPLTVTAQTPDATSLTATSTATLTSGTALPSLPSNFVNTFSGFTSLALNATNVAPANWAYYMGLGGGTLSFPVAAGYGSHGGTGPSGLFFGGSGAADASFTVRYDYLASAAGVPTAVPLPGSAALLLPALALNGPEPAPPPRRGRAGLTPSPAPGPQHPA